MMFWNGDGMHWWGYAFMTVGTLLFWALVIAGIVALVRYAGRSSQPPAAIAQRPTAEQVLAERYARGEIDDEEYQRRTRTLETAHS